MGSRESWRERTEDLLEADAAGEKDVGGRDHDEDGILIRPDLTLFAVADGAGGENGGNVASSLALASLARHFEATQKAAKDAPLFDDLGLPLAARRLSSGVQRANREVLEIARSSERYRGMGTTLVALATDLCAGVVHVAHVGDSRCYRLRAGRLELLTQDHSLAQDVLELSPDLDEATAARLPQNVITRALGMSETVRVSVRSLDVALGDRFLLCSDGLTDCLSDEEIAETMLTANGVRETAARLISTAKEVAEDNIAVVVVRIEAIPGLAAVPKRHATRPHPSAHPRGIGATDDGASNGHEDPEIVIVDSEPPPSDDDAPAVHMVPSVPMPRREILSALQGVVGPRSRTKVKASFPPPRPDKIPAAEPEASDAVAPLELDLAPAPIAPADPAKPASE
jgi:PPM family protein phosphatase